MKKIITIVSLFIFFFSLDTIHADAFDIPAENAIAFDLDSGKILYEKKAKEVVPVASLSKVLTIYLVYKEIQEGRLSWESPVKISNYPFELTTNYNISNIPLDAREYTVRELVNAMLVTNANSPAIALAEKISGTEPLFVDLMKRQLKDWGISDAKLVNATGLSNKLLGQHTYPNSGEDAENMLSAFDLAIITGHLLKDFPEILKITSLTSTSFANQTIYSYNYMLEGMPHFRQGINGLLVGTSEKGGSSFLASSQENDMHLVTIVLNVDKNKEDGLLAFTATNSLLNYISQSFEKVVLLNKNQVVIDNKLTVFDSPISQLSLIADKELTMIQKKGSSYKNELEIIASQKQFYAPISQKKVLAHATFKDPNPIGEGYLGASPSVSLRSHKAIARSFFLKVWWNHFVSYVNTKL
ncbi:D-alanyl-D-alanine carboxypeptidase PBP3 [Streptococcus didelphis]|uniref:D-alanyl-D-alanine carboxypeptidase PBP3 n=1 Tax=Streptococcus didelphis TaxID=102886 RepID=UPI00037AEE79|nr:D-alanyl-D-alanine carboxypeptidase PBP3 [Streptococcus didelphis]